MVTKSPKTTLLNTFSQLFNKSSADGPDSEAPPSVERDRAAFDQHLSHKRGEDRARATEFNHLRSLIRDGHATGHQAKPDPGKRPSNGSSSTPAPLEHNCVPGKLAAPEPHQSQWWGQGSATQPAQVTQDDDDLELDFTGLLALSADAPLSSQPPFEPLALQDCAPDPLERCLRDAALYYAEGNFEAARSLLADLLAEPGTDDAAAQALIYALFDAYRCSDQQQRFDALALEYAKRFGRSPGEWYAIVDRVAAGDAPALQSREAQRAQQTFWRCPATLNLAAWADCIAHQPVNCPLVCINWSALQQMDAQVLPALARQLSAWSSSPVELRWMGLPQLMQALGRLNSDASWLIQLDLLCMAQQVQAFEDLAMEYCIALELSPPSWRKVDCKLVQLDEVQSTDFVATLPCAAQEAEPQAAYATVELCGNLTGKQPQALQALVSASRSVSQITVSCERLGRVDPEATLALRDWLQECRDCEVLFTHLPSLVRVYFQSQGLQELAYLTSGNR